MDKEAKNIRNKKHGEENPEQLKIRRDNNKERHINSRLKRIYGISVVEYNERLKEQGGKCAICGKEVNKLKNKTINFNIDHNHETGEIRGILCNNCNPALPNFEENLKLDENFIQKVNAYLLENK